MSRLVFRGKCDGVAWQKQIRDKYISDGTPDVPHLDVKKAIVAATEFSKTDYS